MWRFFVLCIAAAFASMIQLGDINFDEEDKQLSRLLAQRMRGRSDSPIPDTPDEETTKHFEDSIKYTMNMFEMAGSNVDNEDEDVGRNETRRQAKKPVINQQLNKRVTAARRQMSMVPGPVVLEENPALRQKYYYFPNIPETVDVKERMLDMMQHQIYVTQYRLNDLQRVVDKYSGDLNYRVSFIFCRLETLLFEMKVGHSYMNRTVSKRPAHIHLIYYTYFMKKNIDVTYIVEHLIQIHTEHMENLKLKRAQYHNGSESKGNKTKKNSKKKDEEDKVTTQIMSAPKKKVASEAPSTPPPSDTAPVPKP